MAPSAHSRILIVDDNRVNRRVLESSVTEANHVPVVATNGKECLAILEAADQGSQPPIDLVLLDIMMPDLDGMEVLERIRRFKSPLELPIIMVTAKDHSEDVVAALKAKANDYVMKPIDLDVLLVRMETHLDLKRTHQALVAAQTALLEAGKLESVGFLAAGVAHEIRNPLAQLQMGIDAVTRFSKKPDQELDSRITQILDSMGESVTQANAIVTDLMTYAESKRLPTRDENLNEVIEETLALLEGEIGRSRVTLELNLAKSGVSTEIAIDELKQVLVNVLLNALQAMPDGGTLTISTSEDMVKGLAHNQGTRSGAHLRNGDLAACIEVCDTGPGISPDDLARIYDPFFTSRPTGTGTGLGLTVARRLLELQGGQIQVSNREDGSQGARVRLLLKKKKQLSVI
ncbi:MAG: response regulator [Verrucomicrobiota bacterium]